MFWGRHFLNLPKVPQFFTRRHCLAKWVQMEKHVSYAKDDCSVFFCCLHKGWWAFGCLQNQSTWETVTSLRRKIKVKSSILRVSPQKLGSQHSNALASCSFLSGCFGSQGRNEDGQTVMQKPIWRSTGVTEAGRRGKYAEKLGWSIKRQRDGKKRGKHGSYFVVELSASHGSLQYPQDKFV